MLFNSLDFAIFLPVVFLIYWFVVQNNLKVQNLFIVFASYIFYGWWDWRFLSLIFLSTMVDYTIANRITNESSIKKRRVLLWISIIVNIGLLGYFKYYNFFLENFIAAFTIFGIALNIKTLEVVLPVGISFYTFQTLSYTIDVYKGKLKPSKDFISFCAFVSFFPQLVAGPIERASNLLPQFNVRRKFDYKLAVDGLRQILWGLFKKMVIADSCSEFANQIFNATDEYSGVILFIGAVFFSLQIYGDFSGYSDIAIGVAKLFGFSLMTNFAFPYFSRDIAEFWRRWHISLSTWFRDYLYIPLGGSKGGTLTKIRNTFIIFIVSGFWHGANWTFIAWGALNALFFLPLLVTEKNRNNIDVVSDGRLFASAKDLLNILLTFSLTTIAWIFFRAENINHAFQFISSMLSGLISKSGYIQTLNLFYWKVGYILPLLIAFFVVVEWLGRDKSHALERFGTSLNTPLRWAFYQLLFLVIVLHSGNKQTFIYFQF